MSDSDINTKNDQHENLAEEDFRNIEIQLNSLNDRFNFYRDLIQNTENIESSSLDKSKFTDNHIIMSNLHHDVESHKNKIFNIEQINTTLQNEINYLKRELNSKEEEISRLKLDYKQLKEENSDFDYYTKSIFKGGMRAISPTTTSRITNNLNGIKTDNLVNKRGHRERPESMSSNFTSSTFLSTPHSQELEKMQKDKTNLENQLVIYKLKYAEQSSKVIELEDDRDAYQKKYEALFDKVKVKDEIIKSLISERDSIKYSRLNSSGTRASANISNFSNNANNLCSGYMTERPGDFAGISNTQSHWSACNSPERREHKLESGDYLKTLQKSDYKTNVTSKKIKNTIEINTDCYDKTGAPGTSRNTGFVKILKNIFISDKK